MNRLRALLVVVVAVGTAFVSGAADEKKAPATLAKPVPISTTPHKTAVFNMAAVMRDFNQAKHQVVLLDRSKIEHAPTLTPT